MPAQAAKQSPSEEDQVSETLQPKVERELTEEGREAQAERERDKRRAKQAAKAKNKKKKKAEERELKAQQQELSEIMDELVAKVEEEDARNKEVAHAVAGIVKSLVHRVEENDRLEKIGNRIREEIRLIDEATEADTHIEAAKVIKARWQDLLERRRLAKMQRGFNGIHDQMIRKKRLEQ